MSRHTRARALGASIDEEVAFLRQPEAWPTRPDEVEVVETHLSWVFLAGDEVYKLKKPLRFDLQDLRSPAARQRSCELEVNLNRRLAPRVYLGVVPLAVGRDGRLAVGREGTPVDWMVRMRRLPEDRFLDRCVRRGVVEPECLDAAARLLARFHLKLPPAQRDPRAYLRGLARQVDDAASRLLVPSAGAPRRAVEELAGALIGWMESNAPLLAERVAAGRVVEGHGDLRPEHVCLLDEPVVIDCLEFDVRLRTLDTVDELAYLGLECERIGAPEVGAAFLDTWRDRAKDEFSPSLVAFHQAMRGLVRASIPAMRLEVAWTAERRDEELEARLRERLRDYLDLGRRRLPLLEEAA